MKLFNKIPKSDQIAPVYAVIVVMIYTWSLVLFFRRLPSWLHYSTLGEVSVIFSYMVVVNFLESLMVLAAPLALAILLPKKWFYDQFVTKGSSIVMLGIGYLMLDYGNLLNEVLVATAMLRKLSIIAVAILTLAFLIDRIGFIKKIVQEFSSRSVVFLYIWIPVSLVALLTVLFRNIF